MPKALPPYNATATCPKCGHADVSVFYRKADNYRGAWECERQEVREHLDRRCRKCSYEWCEAVLDQRVDVQVKETP